MGPISTTTRASTQRCLAEITSAVGAPARASGEPAGGTAFVRDACGATCLRWFRRYVCTPGPPTARGLGCFRGPARISSWQESDRGSGRHPTRSPHSSSSRSSFASATSSLRTGSAPRSWAHRPAKGAARRRAPGSAVRARRSSARRCGRRGGRCGWSGRPRRKRRASAPGFPSAPLPPQPSTARRR